MEFLENKIHFRGVNTATDIVRIAITGPECTGKTELARQLASHYHTVWVPEFARTYLERLRRPYSQADLTEIARWQLLMEDELALTANELLICDTDLFVIKIWSEVKYASVDPVIEAALNSHPYHLHLLTYIDVPWEDDPQREHPQGREDLYGRYQSTLEKAGVPYVDIRGTRDERLATAIQAIEKIRH